MLTIKLSDSEYYDEKKQEFIYGTGKTLKLEHSLVSLSKWESIWKKPFLSSEEKSIEETISYIKCMTLTQNVDDSVYEQFTDREISAVNEYIYDSHTATTIKEQKGGGKKQVITAEVIYYWMIALTIPPEYQKWHLNKLLTLIQVCNIKNSPGKKMSKRDASARNASINAANKARFNSKG